MKDYLLKVIASKEARANELKEAIKNATTADEVRSLGATLDAILAELQEAKDQLDQVEADEQQEEQQEEQTNERSFNPMASYKTRGGNLEMNNNETRNINYELAFAKYVTRGTAIPAELRDTTLTTDVSAVIPQNLLNEIIAKIEDYGMILPLITKTSYKVGQTIAVDSVKPKASWVAEGATSNKQKKTTLGSIVFGAFKLRCEIAVSQEVSVQTLDSFNALFVKQVAEAMAIAIETAVVSEADGSTSPTGILYNAENNDKSVQVTAFDYETLVKAEAELPQAYEANAKWTMTKKTFMAIYGMTDKNGQPIGRVNYGINGKIERTLLGRDVVLVPYLPNFADAEAGKAVAYLFDYSDYILNTSYDLGIKSTQDWDTEDHLTKAVMSVDGKVVDRNSLVKLVKA